jgi:UDP-3-O-[3-hydroxymyristoyl] glucosamine N-acyltransferase
MHRLSDFFERTERDGSFLQTQFANSSQPGSVCFVAADKYLRQVNGNPAIACVVTTEALAGNVDVAKGLAISPTPEKAFYQLHNRLVSEFQMRPKLEPFVDPSARIHPSAYVDKYVCIGPEVVVEPGAVVLGGTILKRGALVGPNAAIGADGHFYKRYDGHIFRVLHAGGVVLEQNAQVLSGGVVSKALHTDFTVIGLESVVSIKAHVAHGCKIGHRCIIAGNAQVSGYTEMDNDVWIGPSATIGNLLKIGEGASIEVGSVIIENLDAGRRVSGNFAIDHRSNMMDFARKRRRGR